MTGWRNVLAYPGKQDAKVPCYATGYVRYTEVGGEAGSYKRLEDGRFAAAEKGAWTRLDPALDVAMLAPAAIFPMAETIKDDDGKELHGAAARAHWLVKHRAERDSVLKISPYNFRPWLSDMDGPYPEGDVGPKSERIQWLPMKSGISNYTALDEVSLQGGDKQAKINAWLAIRANLGAPGPLYFARLLNPDKCGQQGNEAWTYDAYDFDRDLGFGQWRWSETEAAYVEPDAKKKELVKYVIDAERSQLLLRPITGIWPLPTCWVLSAYDNQPKTAANTVYASHGALQFMCAGQPQAGVFPGPWWCYYVGERWMMFRGFPQVVGGELVMPMQTTVDALAFIRDPFVERYPQTSPLDVKRWNWPKDAQEPSQNDEKNNVSFKGMKAPWRRFDRSAALLAHGANLVLTTARATPANMAKPPALRCDVPHGVGFTVRQGTDSKNADKNAAVRMWLGSGPKPALTLEANADLKMEGHFIAATSPGPGLPVTAGFLNFDSGIPEKAADRLHWRAPDGTRLRLLQGPANTHTEERGSMALMMVKDTNTGLMELHLAVQVSQADGKVGALGRKGGNVWYGLRLAKRTLPQLALV